MPKYGFHGMYWQKKKQKATLKKGTLQGWNSGGKRKKRSKRRGSR